MKVWELLEKLRAADPDDEVEVLYVGVGEREQPESLQEPIARAGPRWTHGGYENRRVFLVEAL